MNCAKLIIVHPTDGKGDAALPGDDGCGVFCPALEENGWSWIGQLVSSFKTGSGSVALMVPQSEILQSIKEVTGKSWSLSG